MLGAIRGATAIEWGGQLVLVSCARPLDTQEGSLLEHDVFTVHRLEGISDRGVRCGDIRVGDTSGGAEKRVASVRLALKDRHTELASKSCSRPENRQRTVQ